MLGNVLLDRPVVDQTGLTAGYDFRLLFSGEGLRFGNVSIPSVEGTTPPPSLFTILQDLGLKLEASKAPIPVYIVESAEHPAEN